jgi:hypothetical protein
VGSRVQRGRWISRPRGRISPGFSLGLRHGNPGTPTDPAILGPRSVAVHQAQIGRPVLEGSTGQQISRPGRSGFRLGCSLRIRHGKVEAPTDRKSLGVPGRCLADVKIRHLVLDGSVVTAGVTAPSGRWNQRRGTPAIRRSRGAPDRTRGLEGSACSTDFTTIRRTKVILDLLTEAPVWKCQGPGGPEEASERPFRSGDQSAEGSAIPGPLPPPSQSVLKFRSSNGSDLPMVPICRRLSGLHPGCPIRPRTGPRCTSEEPSRSSGPGTFHVKQFESERLDPIPNRGEYESLDVF